jgi:hypothetical protein
MQTMFEALKKLKDVVVSEPCEKYLDNAIEISMEEK